MVWAWVGLGNPGKDYAATRHNIGFMAVEAFWDTLTAARRKDWQNKFDGQLAEAQTAEEKIYLFKPQRFMNRSGPPVQQLLAFYKIPLERLVVFYDELDLPLGRVRIKRGGGAAGHNGIRSLDEALGPDYWRVRLGIGHPGQKHLVTDYVLNNFTSDEQARLEDMLKALAQAHPFLLTGDFSRAQTDIARRPPIKKTETPESKDADA